MTAQFLTLPSQVNFRNWSASDAFALGVLAQQGLTSPIGAHGPFSAANGVEDKTVSSPPPTPA